MPLSRYILKAAWSALTSAASKSQFARRTFSSVGIHYRRTFSRNTLSLYVQSVLAAGSVRGSQPGQLCTGARATRLCKTTWGQRSQISQSWGKISRPLGGKYLHLEQRSPTWDSLHISDFGKNHLQLKGRLGFFTTLPSHQVMIKIKRVVF